MVRQVLESNLGIGKSKLGFWGEKWIFPESCTVTASPVSFVVTVVVLISLSCKLSKLLKLYKLLKLSKFEVV
ncbi:hypothetical protein MTR_8g045945 [Medicago truncatula]|uniref:Uncharacterized protein n=1 Tax=Medicago truncatula TaxID=3880 RepID=A0A072TR09_MEDTR|nr:hypothetical protein MTR_8g045945 [Medicago truncatula]